jgi:hypothetical protein
MELALNNRYHNQQHALKRWLKANQDLINSREILELSKIIGKNGTSKIIKIRESTTKLIEELLEPTIEKFSIEKPLIIKKNLIENNYFINLISKFEVLFPKKHILEKLKMKGIINSKGMPSAAGKKTRLFDFEIIDWYASVASGMLLYYGCVNNLNDLKRFVN